jgi:hypothetical protein
VVARSQTRRSIWVPGNQEERERMFKNTTRRGLAIGAAIAVAFSGLVTSPAQAAGEVVLAPSAGTSYNTFVTEAFTLQASLAPGQVAANAVQMKYKIDKATGASVSYAVSTTSPVTRTAATLNAASTSVVVAAVDAGATTQNFIKLSIVDATSVSSTVDVTVTAFLDANNNSTLDAGEFNTPQTVSFKKYADVATAVVVTTPAQLDVTVSGTVAFTGINTDQVQSARGVVVTVGGTALSSVSATTTFAKAVSALAAGATVSAYAVVNNFKVGADSATVTTTTNTVKAITASGVVGANALNANAGSVSARLNSAFAVQATVKDATTTTASGVAGAAVTAAVTATGLSATKTLTLNGTVYTSSSALPTALAVTSDASGNAVVNVVTAGFAAEDQITFVFKSQNLTADALVVTQKVAVYTAKAAGTGYQTVTLSGAISVALTVADQWKQAAPSNYRVVVSYDGTTKYLPLAAGAVTATFTGTSSATTLNVTVDEVQSQSAVTSNWTKETSAVTTSGAVAVKTSGVAAAFSVAPTHSSTATVARATTSNTAGYTNKVEIKGKANHAGQSVTVTSTGVQFSTAAQDEKAVANTITTTADGDGYWTVSAYVVKAGKATFTYLAGTATASTDVTAAAVYGNEGTALSIVSVDTILPGKTLLATVKLVDEHGNPVAADDAATESLAVTVTGLGFVGTLPTKLNASGEATVTVLLGSADEGSVVITATYDADGTATAKAAVTATKTVAVAAAATPEVNAVIGSFNGRWAVRVENAKGSAVVYKVGGRWFKATASSDNFVFSRKSRVGASVLVKVWVNGDLQNEQTITVK